MLQKLKGYLETKENEIIGIASTDKMDRDGEIIKQEGWDLANFKKNPVILASHNYHEFPIGKATEIRVQDNKLVFKAMFSEATQKAQEAYQLVKEGILKSFSVGFIPREYDEKDRSVITKAELLEISLVAVPANPQAIVTAKEFKENNMAQELIKHWLIDQELQNEEKDMMGGLKKIRQRMSSMAGQMGDMVGMMDEMMNDDGKSIDINNQASEGLKKAKQHGEEGLEVECELNGNVLQSAITYLQKIRTEQNKKGGKK